MEMSIISLGAQTKKGVGLGDIVKVRRGYARYLISQGKAIRHNAANLAQFTAMRAELEKQEAEALQAAKSRAQNLQNLSLSIASRAADESRLYGSLGAREIAKAITDEGVTVEKREIRLPMGPIRHLGEHNVELQLHNEVKVVLKVHVTATR